MATMPSVNSSFLRRSGVRNALRNAESTDLPPARSGRHEGGGGRIQPVVRPHEMSNYLCGRTLAAGRRPAYPRSGVLPPSRRCVRQCDRGARNGVTRPHPDATTTPTRRSAPVGEDRRRTASRLDLCHGRSTERIGRDGELDPAEIAGAEHLDRLALADRAGVDHVQYADCAAVREQLSEPVEVHDLVRHLEPVPEALELRQPHVNGRLTTLERRGDLAPRLRALGAAAGGLALRALAATHAGLGGLRAGRWA